MSGRDPVREIFDVHKVFTFLLSWSLFGVDAFRRCPRPQPDEQSMSQTEEATLNIGALSKATGVPVETIRTWERRYGFPASRRNDAGHRIYELDTVDRLRLITEILSQGYRPSQLQGRSREELEELHETTLPEEESRGLIEDSTAWLDDWIEPITAFDRERLVRALTRHFSRMSIFDFMTHRLAPFLREIGERWSSGGLKIGHEHFATECVRDFLSDRWRPISKGARGERVILATLPGERHCLGLHMAALTAALADRRVVFLGSDTPVEDITVTAEAAEAELVAISLSACADSADSVEFLESLREELATDIELVVGGSGAPEEMTDVEVFDELDEFLDRLES